MITLKREYVHKRIEECTELELSARLENQATVHIREMEFNSGRLANLIFYARNALHDQDSQLRYRRVIEGIKNNQQLSNYAQEIEALYDSYIQSERRRT